MSRFLTYLKVFSFIAILSIFLYFFFVVLVAFASFIGAVDEFAGCMCNNSLVSNLCEVYWEVRECVIKIFFLIVIGLLVALFISVAVLCIESAIHEY